MKNCRWTNGESLDYPEGLNWSPKGCRSAGSSHLDAIRCGNHKTGFGTAVQQLKHSADVEPPAGEG